VRRAGTTAREPHGGGDGGVHAVVPPRGTNVVCIDDALTIPGLLERRAAEDPATAFCSFEGHTLTFGEVDVAVNRLANGLIELGIEHGDRVAVMLPNHPDHILTILALMKAGATWVPLNVHLRGPSLAYVLEHADPRAVIADARYREALGPLLAARAPALSIWRGDSAETGDDGEVPFERLRAHPSSASPGYHGGAHDEVCISYTSGTTGEPKGVIMTDRMLRASAVGARLGGGIGDGDVLLVWEPLYHVGGSEVVVLGLMQRIRLVLVERFSAARFWDQVRAAGATHVHHLGGILQVLMKQPPGERDRDHPVRVFWGGGCTGEVWRPFEERFGVRVREVYGMTEASSITTVNGEGRVGSIGRPVPYFAVRVVDDRGADVGPGTLGELIIQEREPGLIMRGYFRNPEATAAALRDGWLFTGDLARVDEEGFLYYCGRKTDSVRRRGENISAWEVERVVDEHPAVERSALVGVATDVGEQDLKLFVKPAAGCAPDPAGLIDWCQERLPRFQVPRYVAYVDEFDLTPTLRIRKERLSRSTDGCWDRERPAPKLVDERPAATPIPQPEQS